MYAVSLNVSWPHSDTYMKAVRLVNAERMKQPYSHAMDNLMWTHNLGVFTPHEIRDYIQDYPNLKVLHPHYLSSEYMRVSRNIITHALPQV